MADLQRLKTELLSRGFSENKRAKLLRRALFSDYLVEVAPETEDWDEAEQGAHVFIKSKRFATLRRRLFERSTFPFSSYRPRELLEDTSGWMAEVLAAVERRKGESSLYSAAIHIGVTRFGSLLQRMDSPRGFHDALYETELADFIYIQDGPWVYLYIAAEQQLSSPEILRRISSHKKRQSQVKMWRLDKPMDAAVIDAFLSEYRKIGGTR